jgi:hypothetical protein
VLSGLGAAIALLTLLFVDSGSDGAGRIVSGTSTSTPDIEVGRSLTSSAPVAGASALSPPSVIDSPQQTATELNFSDSRERQTPRAAVKLPPAFLQPNRPGNESGDPATESSCTPTGWTLTTNLPENYYGIEPDQADAVSGTSARYHSDTDQAQFGSVLQVVNAADLAGARIQLSSFIKTEAALSGVNLWLWAVASDGSFVARQRVGWIQGTMDWHRSALVMDIPTSAAAIVFGFSMLGTGNLWVDSAQIVRVGPDVPVTEPTELGGNLQPPNLSSLPLAPHNLDFESWSDGCV